MGLNATCGCSNGTLTIDWSNISHNKYAPQLVESFATTLRRNGGDPPGGTPIPEVVGGGVGNSTSLENVTRLTNVTCISYDEFERWCDRGLISQAYCPRVARNQTGQTTKIVYVENVVTIVTNITKQVNNSSNIENVLQREIDAFLASFRNPSTYFYQSNLGIGEFANVMLWAGFLLFCLVSIIREEQPFPTPSCHPPQSSHPCSGVSSPCLLTASFGAADALQVLPSLPGLSFLREHAFA